jgi:signal transduction histidine kinase
VLRRRFRATQQNRSPTRVAPDLNRFSRDLETTIFRIVQESLTNIHRHSGGNHASIKLFRSGDEVLLQVKDNGKGISVSANGGSTNIGSANGRSTKEGSAAGSRVGVGIQGMRERVKQLGGDFEIKSNENGTTVSASFPAASPQSIEPELQRHLL